MHRIRRHLANGPHKGKWQIKDANGVRYVDPYTHSLIMFNCKLRNRPTTAQRINEGDDKTVCAWIDCSTYLIVQDLTPSGWDKLDDNEYYHYNPRIDPFWVDNYGENVDNLERDVLVTDYKAIVDGAGLTTSDLPRPQSFCKV